MCVPERCLHVMLYWAKKIVNIFVPRKKLLNIFVVPGIENGKHLCRPNENAMGRVHLLDTLISNPVDPPRTVS